MKTSQTTEDKHRSAVEALKAFILRKGKTIQKQPNTKVQIRPFQRNQKKTYPHGLLLTLNPKVFSKRLEHHDQLLTLGPQYDDFMVQPDHTLKLPRGQLLPTATDLLRHQVPLLPRIDPQMLKRTSWRQRSFALLQCRMALGFHKILEVVRTLYLEAPHLNEPPVVHVQPRLSPSNKTRSLALPHPTVQDHVADLNRNPDYSHNCIHCWSPSQSSRSPSPSYHSDKDSYHSDTDTDLYHSDTDSSGTSTSEQEPDDDLPNNFHYSPTSPTYGPASPGYYQDPEVALYLTV